MHGIGQPDGDMGISSGGGAEPKGPVRPESSGVEAVPEAEAVPEVEPASAPEPAVESPAQVAAETQAEGEGIGEAESEAESSSTEAQSGSGRSFQQLAQDHASNPQDWRVQSVHVEQATRRAARNSGVSIQEFHENVETGERVVQHTVINDSGKVVDGPHLRPYYKPRSGE